MVSGCRADLELGGWRYGCGGVGFSTPLLAVPYDRACGVRVVFLAVWCDVMVLCGNKSFPFFVAVWHLSWNICLFMDLIIKVFIYLY